MSISIETAILLPDEVMLWQGQDYKSTSRSFPRYILTDERLLVQNSKTSYKGFDLSQIVAIEFEQKKDYALITLTPYKGDLPYITLKLDSDASAVYRKLEEARARSISRMVAMGEQPVKAVRVSGFSYLFYNFIRQNGIFLFYIYIACLAAWASWLPLGMLCPLFLWGSLLFFSTRRGRFLLEYIDLRLRRLLFRVDGTEKLVVPRRLATFSSNLILVFWCALILLFFLGFLLI